MLALGRNDLRFNRQTGQRPSRARKLPPGTLAPDSACGISMDNSSERAALAGLIAGGRLHLRVRTLSAPPRSGRWCTTEVRGVGEVIGAMLLATVLSSCGGANRSSSAHSTTTTHSASATTTASTATRVPPPPSVLALLLPCKPPSPVSANPGFDSPAVRPATVHDDCGAAHPYTWFSNLTWTSWGHDSATGTGDLTVNTCTPDCAAGNNSDFPATLSLSQPMTVVGYSLPIFTVLKVHFTVPPSPSATLGLTEQAPTDYSERLPMTCPSYGC